MKIMIFEGLEQSLITSKTNDTFTILIFNFIFSSNQI